MKTHLTKQLESRSRAEKVKAEWLFFLALNILKLHQKIQIDRLRTDLMDPGISPLVCNEMLSFLMGICGNFLKGLWMLPVFGGNMFCLHMKRVVSHAFISVAF